MIQGFDIKVLAKLQTIYDLITSSPPGSTTWGSITGTLSSQTDLQTALDAKFDLEDINPICKLGENINKGQAVYISSANGTNMIISKASNAAESTSSKTFGLLSATGVTNDQIRVITSGFLAGLDTSTANAAGDPVWLGTGGNLIYGLANKPVAPAHLVFIGIVTRKQSNNGEIFIKVQNGFELQELHDVDAVNPSNNDGIFYNTSTSLWEHKSIATVLGYTPYSAANPSGYITSSALSPYLTSATAASTYQPIGTYATASNSMSFTNKSGNISQWTNDSGYITSSALSPYLTSATAASTYQTILSAASASANGYLTSTDWSTFNNKQAAITLTTTGTSGAATLVGTTLNVPTYAGAGSGTSIQTITGSTTGLTAATTRYGTVTGTTSEGQVSIPLAAACTINNLYVRTTATMPANSSLQVTIVKNAVATSVSVTIAAGSAAGIYSDTTNNATFSAGDRYQIEFKNTGSAAAAATSGQSFKITI
jgi:hypothetical protein